MSIARQTNGGVGRVWTQAGLGRVLVVADESRMLDAISREAGFEVAFAESGASALRAVRETEVDLVVLDVALPDISGIDLLREVRAIADVPVILLGAGESAAERVLALESGADDEVAQRRQHAVDAVREVGPLRIDPGCHEVMLGDRRIEVTVSEFRILALLGASPGTVFTRRQIMEEVWDGPYFGDGHPVDTHMLNLRRKIEADPARPRRLLTVRGVGFKLVALPCGG